MKTFQTIDISLKTYVRPAAECVDLLPEGALMGFSQGQPIVTPNSADHYYSDDYDEE